MSMFERELETRKMVDEIMDKPVSHVLGCRDFFPELDERLPVKMEEKVLREASPRKWKEWHAKRYSFLREKVSQNNGKFKMPLSEGMLMHYYSLMLKILFSDWRKKKPENTLIFDIPLRSVMELMKEMPAYEIQRLAGTENISEEKREEEKENGWPPDPIVFVADKDNIRSERGMISVSPVSIDIVGEYWDSPKRGNPLCFLSISFLNDRLRIILRQGNRITVVDRR